MSNSIRINKVTFTKLGHDHVEYVLGTNQQINDYMISTASSVGAIYSNFPVENDGGLLWNVADIKELKIL
jgi:hypothetical protein